MSSKTLTLPRIMMPPYRLNPDADLNQGLVAKYISLPGMTGGRYWYDMCGKNHGTLTGMTSGYGWQGPQGRSGGWGAMRFDGTDDYLPTGKIHSLGSAVSVSAWILAAVWSNYDSPCGQASNGAWVDGFGFYYLTSQVRFYINSYTINVASKAAPSTGAWHHIVGTYDGATIKIYVNTSPGTSDTYGSAITPGSRGFEIGVLGNYTPGTFNGYLDDISIYNRALSATEVAGLYEASKNQYRNEIISGNGAADIEALISTTTYFLPQYSAPLSLQQRYRPSTWAREITTATQGVLTSKATPRIMVPPYRLNPHAPLNQGLVAKYIALPGMTGGRLWYDLCGKNPGTLTGMTSSYGWQGPQGRPGGWGSMRFDGSDDYAVGTTAFSITGNANLTFSAWIFPTSVVAPASVAGFGNGGASLGACSLMIGVAAGAGGTFSNGSGNVSLEFAGGNGGRTGTGAIAVSTWSHICGVKTAGAINTTTSIYVNGKPVSLSTSSASTPNIVSGYSLAMGRFTANTANYYWPGRIDDISIYNRALSAAEVAGLYEASKTQYRDEILCAYEI